MQSRASKRWRPSSQGDSHSIYPHILPLSTASAFCCFVGITCLGTEQCPRNPNRYTPRLFAMRLWVKLKKNRKPAFQPTSSATQACFPIDQAQYHPARGPQTTSGHPIQKPLPVPAPYISHPHITGYSASLIISGPHTICRCLLPTAHGDAFTRRHHASAANGISFLDRSGSPLIWEQAAHAFLDVVGADSRASPGWHMEDEVLLRNVYHEDTVRAIKRYHDAWEGVRRHGQLRCVLEDDVFWWGVHNPKGVVLRAIGEGRTRSDGAVVTVNGPFYGAETGEGTRTEREQGR